MAETRTEAKPEDKKPQRSPAVAVYVGAEPSRFWTTVTLLWLSGTLLVLMGILGVLVLALMSFEQMVDLLRHIQVLLGR